MMNGKDINDAIARKDKGTVALAITKNKTAAKVIHDLYMASLNRPPRQSEIKQILSKLPLRREFMRKDTVASQYQDLFWALLNSNEFILNH